MPLHHFYELAGGIKPIRTIMEIVRIAKVRRGVYVGN